MNWLIYILYGIAIFVIFCLGTYIGKLIFK